MVSKIKLPVFVVVLSLCLFTLPVFAVTSPAADAEDFSQAYKDTLTVYGNANMDDIIDQDDIDYVRAIIRGERDKTQFTDANNDGIINEDDVAQIEAIIDGDEDVLYILDMANRTVNVPMPVDKVVSASYYDSTRTLIQLGAQNKIVGCSFPGPKFGSSSIRSAAPELENLPDPGNRDDLNVELILSLNPGAIFVSPLTDADLIQEKTNIPTLVVRSAGDIWTADMLRIIGAVTGEDERARELIDYSNDKIGEITAITSKIKDEDKPFVYICGPGGGTGDMSAICRSSADKPLVNIVGGKVQEDTPEESKSGAVQISKEQVIKWNPDLIAIHGGNADEINGILSDPDLQSINAVKNGKVYSLQIAENGAGILGEKLAEIGYLAKLMHPDKFEDLNVEKNGNEIMKFVYGADGLYTDMANSHDFYQWN